MSTKSYLIKGVYVMKFYIDVDEEVLADSEEEAIQTVQDQISAGQAYDQDCIWLHGGPDIGVIEV